MNGPSSDLNSKVSMWLFCIWVAGQPGNKWSPYNRSRVTSCLAWWPIQNNLNGILEVLCLRVFLFSFQVLGIYAKIFSILCFLSFFFGNFLLLLIFFFLLFLIVSFFNLIFFCAIVRFLLVPSWDKERNGWIWMSGAVRRS